VVVLAGKLVENIIFIITCIPGLKITAGQWPDKMTVQNNFDRTFLNFEGRLTGQMLILAGHCPLTSRYFEPYIPLTFKTISHSMKTNY